MPRKQWWWLIAVVALAATQFARCYGSLTVAYLNLTDYANGTAPMPFQGRMLLMWPLRWAQQSSALQHFTAGREGAFRSPAMLVITALAAICTGLTCWLATLLYLRASRRSMFPWLPAVLVLAMAPVHYILRSQNVLYPYDLLSVLLFTLGLLLIYTRRGWWLVLLFPVATLNREVTLFLILLLVLDRVAEAGFAGLRRVPVLAQVVLMSAMWIGLHLYVQHRFAANATETHARVPKNLRFILSPLYWPQLAAVGAYTVPFILLYRRRIADARLRTYLWVLLPWLAMMLYYGEIVETRLFGELAALFAVTAALELEESVAVRSPALNPGLTSS